MRASKLVHEPWDDTVEVNAIVKAGLREIDEIRGSDGNTVKIDLRSEAPHGRVECGGRIRHVCRRIKHTTGPVQNKTKSGDSRSPIVVGLLPAFVMKSKNIQIAMKEDVQA